jgi:hypothetical protein
MVGAFLMKSPIILVEGQDVSLFASAAALEHYVESPDIECYRVFDADGQVLSLTSDTPPPKRGLRLGWVAVGKVRLSRREPPEAAPTELAQILSDFLARLTGRSREGADLGDLIRELMQQAQVDD